MLRTKAGIALAAAALGVGALAPSAAGHYTEGYNAARMMAYYVARADCGRASDWWCYRYPWGVEYAVRYPDGHTRVFTIGYLEKGNGPWTNGQVRFCRTRVAVSHDRAWRIGKGCP